MTKEVFKVISCMELARKFEIGYPTEEELKDFGHVLEIIELSSKIFKGAPASYFSLPGEMNGVETRVLAIRWNNGSDVFYLAGAAQKLIQLQQLAYPGAAVHVTPPLL